MASKHFITIQREMELDDQSVDKKGDDDCEDGVCKL